MTHMTRTAAGVGLCLALTAASAQDGERPAYSEDQLRELLATKISVVETLAFHPKLVAAVKSQNAEPLSESEILDRDDAWAESRQNMFRHSLLNSEASRILAGIVGNNEFFTEAFLTDKRGANVATYPATSDYWQGDEEKWAASYNDGEGVTFLGPVEFDESTASDQIQVSAPVIDVVSNETLGVLVVGINVSYVATAE